MKNTILKSLSKTASHLAAKAAPALALTSRGFTLLELLVVIAIIGILSSVVISSVSSARTQAYDAKVKAQLSNIRSSAELYFNSRLSYGTVTYWTANGTSTNGCQAGMFQDTASGMQPLTISVNYPVGENTIVCNSSGAAYAVSDNLSATSTWWCVDSSGASKQRSTALGTSTVCS